MKKMTEQLMAEYIRNTDCGSCCVCSLLQECNTKYMLAEEKGENYQPNEQDCINGIIDYFQRKSAEGK